MTDSIAEPTDTTAEAPKCDHHWVSSHEPGLDIWVVQCSMCRRFNAKDMQEQIDATPRPFGRPDRTITPAAVRSHLKAATRFSNLIARTDESTSPFIPIWAARASLELEWARTLAAVMQVERAAGGDA